MRGLRTDPDLGSHLPVLMRALALTNGPVLELGSGTYSTPFLHWACFQKRYLLTMEGDAEWWGYAQNFRDDHHEVRLVPEWVEAKLDGPWSVVLLNHAGNRAVSLQRLRQVEYVVCHDTCENKAIRRYWTGFRPSWFRYRWDWKAHRPYTSVFSNVHDLKDFHL